MNTERYLAISRYSLIIAGVMFAVGVALHPDETAAGFVPDTTWQYLHAMLGISLILLSMGFSALAAKTESRDSWLMTASFIVFAMTSALASGLLLFVEGFVLPAAVTDPAYLPFIAEDGPLFGGALGAGFMLLLAVWSLAGIASGIFIARIARKHSYTGYLFFAAPLAAFSPPLPHLVMLAGGIVLGAGAILLGLNLKEFS